MRLLIISHDVIGTFMAGPGIRYWELARALAPCADVTLVAPQPIDLQANGVRTGHYAWGNAASLATYLRDADVILANGFLLEAHPELAAAHPALIIDLYDPILLENLELMRTAPTGERTARARHDVELLNRQLAAGDMFLCATERQRDLYIGALMAAGRITPAQVDADPLLRGLIEVVPFGLPAEPPVRSGMPALRSVLPGINDDDQVVLWSGGLWDWMDPQTLVRAVALVAPRLPRLRLVFLAGRHPGAVQEMHTPAAARTLACELALLERHVFFYEDWLPYARRADFLLEADLLVSLHRPGLESAYAAVRSRFLDHLWAGRTSLVAAGDAAAALVVEHNLGRVVPPENIAATADALTTLLNNEDERTACAERARALAALYSWQQVAAPLCAWCRTIAQNERGGMKDAYTSSLRHNPRRAQVELEELRTETSASAQTVGKGAGSESLQTSQGFVVMDDQTRSEHIGRLDGLWKLEPRPLESGLPLVGQLKERANSLTRWYVQSIIEQQNGFNAAVVQALQALAANDDRRHNELIMYVQMLNINLDHTRHLLTQLTRKLDTLSNTHQRVSDLGAWLDSVAGKVQSAEQQLGEFGQHIADVDDLQTTLAERLLELQALLGAPANSRDMAQASKGEQA